MSTTKPINRWLYNRLELLFGDVQIRDAGVQMLYEYLFDPVTKRFRLVVVESGEHYWVNCNLCGDKRHRLSISANWFFRDREKGQTWSHLIHCFNENCYANHWDRVELYERLRDSQRCFVPSPQRLAAEVKPGEVDLSAPTRSLPSGFTRLRDLPRKHVAIRYLLKRGFDPAIIDRTYRVGFTESRRAPFFARERLIIPAYSDGECVGWQARHIWEIDLKGKDAPPKYFTCPGMKRGRVLYNLDRAVQYNTIVIVEGPTDVWRVGPMGVAIWGNSITRVQGSLLAQKAKHASLVLMLDPDAMRNRELLNRNLRQIKRSFKRRIVQCMLPKGSDPGCCERDWLRDFMKSQAERQDVEINLRKLATSD